MSDFNYELRTALHERLTEIRGRRVSLNKVIKAFEQHLGHFDFYAFEYLFDEIRAPWQLRVLWSDPEGELLDGQLAWYRSRDDALWSAVRMVDGYRIYPNRIETTPEGGARLYVDQMPLLEVAPLCYYTPPDEFRLATRAAFSGPGGAWRGEVLRHAAHLPGLAQMHCPYGANDALWAPDFEALSGGHVRRTVEGTPVTEMGTRGILEFTPEAAAQACVTIGTQLNIALSLADAQLVVAGVMGFDDWTLFLASWAANQAFQPYLFDDREAGTTFFCRDAPDALAAFAQAAAAIEQQKDFEWSIRGGYTDKVVFELNGPLRYTTYDYPGLRSGQYRDTQREKADPHFHRIRIEVATPGLPHLLRLGFHEFFQYDLPVEASPAQVLSEMLGVGLSGQERIRLSDLRLRLKAIDVGSVHITAAKADAYSDRCFYYECLDSVTGWRIPAREYEYFPDAQFSKIWHREGEAELRRVKTQVTICEANPRRKKLRVMVRWKSMSESDQAALIAFTGMRPTPEGAAYPSSNRTARIMDNIRESIFSTGMHSLHELTFRQRRQALLAPQADAAPPSVSASVLH